MPVTLLSEVPEFRRWQAEILATLDLEDKLQERAERKALFNVMAARRI